MAAVRGAVLAAGAAAATAADATAAAPPSTAPPAGALYRHFRFTAQQVRSDPDMVQISEFVLMRGGAPLPRSSYASAVGGLATGGTARDPDGVEGAMKAVDGDVATKWLSGSFDTVGWDAPLYVSLSAPTAVDAATFYTANDAPERDPTAWSVAGCPAQTVLDCVTDPTMWTEVGSASGAPATARKAASGIVARLNAGGCPDAFLREPQKFVAPDAPCGSDECNPFPGEAEGTYGTTTGPADATLAGAVDRCRRSRECKAFTFRNGRGPSDISKGVFFYTSGSTFDSSDFTAFVSNPAYDPGCGPGPHNQQAGAPYSPPAPQYKYVVKTTGACAHPVTTTAECTLAVEAIAPGASVVPVPEATPDSPVGCYLQLPKGIPYVNAGVPRGSGADCTDTMQCVCREGAPPTPPSTPPPFVAAIASA